MNKIKKDKKTGLRYIELTQTIVSERVAQHCLICPPQNLITKKAKLYLYPYE